MVKKILLGFDAGFRKPATGEEVFVEVHHTVVTGMTQLSGKTTCLEALVERGKVKAITFLTKKGESGFRNQREIKPYFREQKKGGLIDWQYVEAILEATMGERMKFERSWIIKACKGAHSLKEVYQNIKEEQKDARRPLDESIYTNLAAYFEIILPEIAKYKFASSIRLRKGFNVLNLIGMADEMQQLIIESVLAYILAKMENIVVVIPEAHKFIPQGSKTPVKGTALKFIREGAAIGNFMWLDCQETTSVDKQILKQCGNWIMGFQQEKNEVASVRMNIGRRKIKDEDIMSLKLGHFIASLKQEIHHVYVLPAGVPEEKGRGVAMGTIPVEAVRNTIESFKPDPSYVEIPDQEEEEEVPEDTHPERLKEIQDLKKEIEGLTETIENMEKQGEAYRTGIDALESDKEQLQKEKDELQADNEDLRETVERQGKELDQFEALKILLNQMIDIPRPTQITQVQTGGVDVSMEIESPSLEIKRVRKVINLVGESVEGRILLLWVDGIIGPDNKWIYLTPIKVAFQARHWPWSNPNGRAAMDKLTSFGFFEFTKKGNRNQWRATMTPSEAMEKGLLKIKEAPAEKVVI